jgi:hypothetical protein
MTITSQYFDLYRKDLMNSVEFLLDNNFVIPDEEFYHDMSVGRIILELSNQRLDQYKLDYHNTEILI